MNVKNEQASSEAKVEIQYSGFPDAHKVIHGEVGKCQAIQITKAEADRLVRAYLHDIVCTDTHLELGESTGSSDLHRQAYAWDRIDHLVRCGVIAAEEVNQMEMEAYEPLKKALKLRAHGLKQIAIATGAIVDGEVEKPGDIVISFTNELPLAEDGFCLYVKKGETGATEVFKTIAEAVEWVKSFVVGDRDRGCLTST